MVRVGFARVFFLQKINNLFTKLDPIVKSVNKSLCTLKIKKAPELLRTIRKQLLANSPARSLLRGEAGLICGLRRGVPVGPGSGRFGLAFEPVVDIVAGLGAPEGEKKFEALASGLGGVDALEQGQLSALQMEEVLEPKQGRNDDAGEQKRVIIGAEGLDVVDGVLVEPRKKNEVVQTHESSAAEVALGLFGLEADALPSLVRQEILVDFGV